MTTALFALTFPPSSIVDWIIWIIIVAACVGIMYVALRVFGVTIPGWVIQIVWIVVAAIVAIAAIRIIASL